MIDIVYIL